MSALLITRPRAREGDAERIARGQERLFGDAAIATPPVPPAVAPAAPAPPELGHPHEPVDATSAPAARTTPAEPSAVHARTLDAAVSSLWASLTAGEAATCPVCDTAMEPRRSPAAGVVGGRCRSCGSTLA
jgi:hypothetical protein